MYFLSAKFKPERKHSTGQIPNSSTEEEDQLSQSLDAKMSLELDVLTQKF